MKNYRLSRAAQEDLREIKSYSLTTWGKKQTQNYLAAIETTLEKLTVSPDLGKSRDDLITGLCSFKINRHVIFYRCHLEELEVVRILHGRMDIPAYFESH
jgi:toxin ParE1/3/4